MFSPAFLSIFEVEICCCFKCLLTGDLMPCNDQNFLSRYDLGKKEHVNMESQAKFPLPKSKVKNLSGPDLVEDPAHDMQEF